MTSMFPNVSLKCCRVLGYVCCVSPTWWVLDMPGERYKARFEFALDSFLYRGYSLAKWVNSETGGPPI